jgi:phage protein D
VARIAADNGLTAACHPDIAATVVASIEQAHKSDMELMRDLGRRHDAVATVKAGR